MADRGENRIYQMLIKKSSMIMITQWLELLSASSVLLIHVFAQTKKFSHVLVPCAYDSEKPTKWLLLRYVKRRQYGDNEQR